VEVFDVAVVKVLPVRTTLAGPAGSTFPLTLEVKDSAGAPLSMPAEWSSADPKVATVDAAGVWPGGWGPIRDSALADALRPFPYPEYTIVEMNDYGFGQAPPGLMLRTREAFDLAREDLRTRERYGDTHFGKSLLTCRRLIEAGARFVQCQANYRLRPETGRTSNWDDHSVNSDIFKAYEEKMPFFDQAVSALIEDLYQRGLDGHVLFVFCGEFGRTPRIEYQDASRRPGRDHWPRAMSVLVAGGGLKMGQVVGATNARGEEPSRRAMNSNCLLATIYHRFGIDLSHVYHDRTGRPIPILPEAEPIAELL